MRPGRFRLEISCHLVLVAGCEDDGAKGGAFLLVVFVEFHRDRSGGVGGFPAPFADGDKAQRDPLVRTKAGAIATDEKLVADADVGGDEEARGTVGGEGAFGGRGGAGGGF